MTSEEILEIVIKAVKDKKAKEVVKIKEDNRPLLLRIK